MDTLAPAARPLPFVSVVLPVRNEASYLERSLGAVLAQDHPADRMEILVVDGGSTDGTAQRAQELDSARVRVLSNPAGTAAAAMNLGIAAARGDVILRVDGHAEIGPAHISRALAALALTGADVVGGPIVTRGRGFAGRALALAMSSRLGVGGSRFRVDAAHAGDVDTVPFPAYTRSVLQRVGSFDESFVRNQDDEFHLRLTRAGGRIHLAPELVSIYHARRRFAQAWTQFVGYGFWKTAVRRKHGGLPSLRGYVPAVFVVLLAVALVWSLVAVSWLPFLAVGGPYALCLLAWSATWGLERDARGAPGAPWAFAVLHLAYGCGFLLGLVRDARSPGSCVDAPVGDPA
jgi:glycosyltransferase involved in cell wall biosynthesis